MWALHKEIVLVDRRDPKESKQHTPLWIGSCDYFVIRLSDKGMNIGRLNLLKDDLAEHIPSLKDNEQVIVTHYAIYMNAGAQMTAAAFAAGASVAGGAAPGSPVHPTARCSRENMSGGWFDSSEISTNKPPLVAEVDVEVRGKKYSARYVQSQDKNFNDNSSNKKYGDIKISVFHQVNEILAQEIANDLL